jgi:hypothetical protein
MLAEFGYHRSVSYNTNLSYSKLKLTDSRYAVACCRASVEDCQSRAAITACPAASTCIAAPASAIPPPHLQSKLLLLFTHYSPHHLPSTHAPPPHTHTHTTPPPQQQQFFSTSASPALHLKLFFLTLNPLSSSLLSLIRCFLFRSSCTEICEIQVEMANCCAAVIGRWRKWRIQCVFLFWRRRSRRVFFKFSFVLSFSLPF